MAYWQLDAARGYLAGFRNGRSRRDGIRILCYHGVVERKTDPRLERNMVTLDQFRAHLRFLRRFRVLSLAELTEVLASPAQKPRTAVVITFDDGYANNLIAAEMLAEAGMPWAVFVSTGAVGRGNAVWTIELSLLVLHGQRTRMEALERPWSLKSRAEREAAFQAIRFLMKAMQRSQRRDLLDQIRRQFPDGETERLLQQFPSLQMMSWEEIEELAQAGVEVGSHGVDHEIHHAGQPEAVRRRELAASKSALESRLQNPCRFFAFPNGDFGPGSAREVEEAGYDLAFTTQAGAIEGRVNPYLLPRLTGAASLQVLARDFFWELAVQ